MGNALPRPRGTTQVQVRKVAGPGVDNTYASNREAKQCE